MITPSAFLDDVDSISEPSESQVSRGESSRLKPSFHRFPSMDFTCSEVRRAFRSSVGIEFEDSKG
jgi:hypothetical protein